MLSVIIENKYGEQLNFANKSDYEVLVSGLTPPTATINTVASATKDGSTYNSSRLNERNLVLTIIPRNNIEKNRLNVYRYVKSKQYIKVYLKTSLRDVWIEGYVESVEGDLYENPQKLQVSIRCPDPLFKAIDVQTVSFSNITSLFEFPFSSDEVGKPMSENTAFSRNNVYNDSDDEAGIYVELIALGTVLEPTIYNETTNEHFTIDYEMQAGDKIILNTRRGEKRLLLIRDGIITNILNSMTIDSKWFMLVEGDNIFSYSCAFGSENLTLIITFQPVFEGV